MPREYSALNARAWSVWSTLDGFGRDFDTMAGNPMPLRIEAIDTECARHGDPDAIRWRVLEIEKKVLAGRRMQAKEKKQ
ncbi:hypothetical protein [uncultured Desulfovibrio sp.]|uniref:hypothetical protein n=1 Tax=uncultured Desulfovibrio sp. TaxID=167968 RepID=UPI00272B397D|nr:hypothetical protein [uncultured Desulfovibrio sp.]